MSSSPPKINDIAIHLTGDRFLDIDSGRDDEYLSAPTQHYTFIFNVLVLMTLFNEINARKIDGSTNVFSGLHRSRMFIVIWTTTFIFQVSSCQSVIKLVASARTNYLPVGDTCVSLSIQYGATLSRRPAKSGE